LGGEEWLVLIDGRNKENRMDVCSSFERMEVNRDNVGSLKIIKKFYKGFGNITFYWFSYKT
jgi:hypothetical protein